MVNDTPFKYCSRKENCVHPMGCWQPASVEHFHFNTRDGKLSPHCKACHSAGRKKPKRPVETLPDGYKRCTQRDECVHPDGSLLPATLEIFRYSKRGKYQLSAKCRLCENAQARVQSKTPETATKKRQYAFEYYHSPEGHPKRIAYARKRVVSEATKERAIEYGREYRMRPDIQIAKQIYRQEYKKQPQAKELSRLAGVRYRARIRSLPDTLTLEQWGRALDYFNGCCAICGRQLTDLFGTHRTAADHWIPISKPNCPGTVAENIIPLCHGVNGCNNHKHATMPDVWLTRMFGVKKAKGILKRVDIYFAWVREQDGVQLPHDE